MWTSARRVLVSVVLLAVGARGQEAPHLERAGQRLAALAGEFTNVSCSETVTQSKLNKDGRVLQTAQSHFDYLLTIRADAVSLALDESRIPKPNAGNLGAKLMGSNGFATLFLVLHPYYRQSYEFAVGAPQQTPAGTQVAVAFRAIPGRPTPAVLYLRGREYPLELEGTALLDASTGDVVRMTAHPAGPLDDLGIRRLDIEVEYGRVPLRKLAGELRFARSARIELATDRQRWRNLHRFTDYRQFSVDTEEVVATPEVSE